MLLLQFARLARSRALDNAGNRSAARIAMMAMTTSNSINVNARRRAVRDRTLKASGPIRKIGLLGGLIVPELISVPGIREVCVYRHTELAVSSLFVITVSMQ